MHLLVQEVFFKCLQFKVGTYKKCKQSENIVRFCPRSSSQKLLSQSSSVFEWNGDCVRVKMCFSSVENLFARQ